MRSITVLFCVLLVAACAGEPLDYAELSRQGPVGVAIDGYSPVSYFTEGTSERGLPEFEVSHNGTSYWLTNAGQVAAFKADPHRYQPAHGGWCSLMLTGSGQMTPANPESFKIVDNRLLLFWSGDFKGQAIDGRNNWHSKFVDRAGEEALLARADAAWIKLLSGRAKQKIVLFNEDDGTRISETRFRNAKKQYE